MNETNWLKIKEVFDHTINLPISERARFLADQEKFVLAEVSRLLESHEKLDDFIAQPLIVEIGWNVNSYLGRKIGNYKILSLLGKGGMGQVFLAEKDGLEKKFALKIIKRGMDTEAVLNRFVRERQILSRLEHPNIARILDIGSTDDGLPFFVMEFIEGDLLNEFCFNYHLDIRERLELFQKVCEAVKYAHQNLVIHRDIKPSNILITPEGTPKLLDFGVAKLLTAEGFENTETAAKYRMFTPEYASPEQINGLPITTATDVYSLGVVLYELLSGVRPFNSNGKDYREVVSLVLTEDPVPPSAIGQRSNVKGQSSEKQTLNNNVHNTKGDENQTIRRSQIPNPKSLRGDLDNIILKSLRKEPERRYQTVQEFSEDIRRYLVGLPVTASADSGLYRFKKFVNRHKIGSILAALLFSLSSFAIWQSFVANRERAKAERHVSQVREVARSLLNETSQNLNNLPDGLEVRQKIIEKSAKILDSLSSDIDDIGFLSELGIAYQQLGWSRTWHLRDYVKAMEDLEKARKLHEKVVELEPNNFKYLGNLAGTLNTLNEFYTIQGNSAEVAEICEKIVKLNLKQVELEPNNPQIFFDTSNRLDFWSDILKNQGRNEESFEASKKSFVLIESAIELQKTRKQTPDIQTQLSFMMMSKAALFRKSDKKDEAILTYLQAAEIADKSFAADNSQRLAFNHSTRSRRLAAEVFGSKNEWQKALELYQICLNRWLQNQENKQLDQKSVMQAIPTYTMRVGFGLNKVGRKTEGREMVEKGLDLYLNNIKMFDNLAADILGMPEFLLPVSDYYLEIGENRKAADLWQKEVITRLEKLLQNTPNDVGMLNLLSFSFERIGDYLSNFRVENDSISETNSKTLKEAIENYENALEQNLKVEIIEGRKLQTKQKAENIQHKISMINNVLAN